MQNVATAITSVSVLALRSEDVDTLKWCSDQALRLKRCLKAHQLSLISALQTMERSTSEADDVGSNLGEIRGRILLVMDMLRTIKETIGYVERKLAKLSGANPPLGSGLPEPFRQALQPFLQPMPLAA